MTLTLKFARPQRGTARSPRRMRRSLAPVAAALACACGSVTASSSETLLTPGSGSLATDRTVYSAHALDGAPGRYGFVVAATLTNLSTDTVFLERCTPDAAHPVYSVVNDEAGGGRPAYDPAWACVGHDRQIAVAPHESRTDELTLDVGVPAPANVALAGRFRIRYIVQSCRGSGNCPAPSWGLSNAFDVQPRP